MKIPRPKLNALELALWGAFVVALAYMAGVYRTAIWLRPFVSPGTTELQQLGAKYGPARNSLNGEEWIVRDYFSDQRNGVFVDVGANHYRHFSNTYYLETALGWSGVAVEPQIKFAADYASYRPMTRFVPLFVSDVSNSQAVLYVPPNDLVASFDKQFAESESDGPIVAFSADTTTLDHILDGNGIGTIDFLSIDVELHEPEVLKGFSIERFRPRLVAVEAHVPVRQQVLEYFAKHQYVVLGKYLRADQYNLWFAPLSDARHAAPLATGHSH